MWNGPNSSNIDVDDLDQDASSSSLGQQWLAIIARVQQSILSMALAMCLYRARNPLWVISSISILSIGLMLVGFMMIFLWKPMKMPCGHHTNP